MAAPKKKGQVRYGPDPVDLYLELAKTEGESPATAHKALKMVEPWKKRGEVLQHTNLSPKFSQEHPTATKILTPIIQAGKFFDRSSANAYEALAGILHAGPAAVPTEFVSTGNKKLDKAADFVGNTGGSLYGLAGFGGAGAAAEGVLSKLAPSIAAKILKSPAALQALLHGVSQAGAMGTARIEAGNPQSIKDFLGEAALFGGGGAASTAVKAIPAIARLNPVAKAVLGGAAFGAAGSVPSVVAASDKKAALKAAMPMILAGAVQDAVGAKLATAAAKAAPVVDMAPSVRESQATGKAKLEAALAAATAKKAAPVAPPAAPVPAKAAPTTAELAAATRAKLAPITVAKAPAWAPAHGDVLSFGGAKGEFEMVVDVQPDGVTTENLSGKRTTRGLPALLEAHAKGQVTLHGNAAEEAKAQAIEDRVRDPLAKVAPVVVRPAVAEPKPAPEVVAPTLFDAHPDEAHAAALEAQAEALVAQAKALRAQRVAATTTVVPPEPVAKPAPSISPEPKRLQPGELPVKGDTVSLADGRQVTVLNESGGTFYLKDEQTGKTGKLDEAKLAGLLPKAEPVAVEPVAPVAEEPVAETPAPSAKSDREHFIDGTGPYADKTGSVEPPTPMAQAEPTPPTAAPEGLPALTKAELKTRMAQHAEFADRGRAVFGFSRENLEAFSGKAPAKASSALYDTKYPTGAPKRKWSAHPEWGNVISDGGAMWLGIPESEFKAWKGAIPDGTPGSELSDRIVSNIINQDTKRTAGWIELAPERMVVSSTREKGKTKAEARVIFRPTPEYSSFHTMEVAVDPKYAAYIIKNGFRVKAYSPDKPLMVYGTGEGASTLKGVVMPITVRDNGWGTYAVDPLDPASEPKRPPSVISYNVMSDEGKKAADFADVKKAEDERRAADAARLAEKAKAPPMDGESGAVNVDKIPFVNQIADALRSPFEWYQGKKQAESNKGTDSRIEAATASSRGMGVGFQRIAQSIKDSAQRLKDDFTYRPGLNGNPVAKEQFRRAEGINADAKRWRAEQMDLILNPLESPKELDSFGRIAALRDYRESIGLGQVVPENLTLAEVDAEEARVRKLLTPDEEARVDDAIDAHDITNRLSWQELQRRGLVDPTAPARTNYMPHHVLDFIGSTKREYTKARKGSGRLIENDYVTAMGDHLERVFKDNAMDDARRAIATSHDILPTLSSAEQQALGLTKPHGNPAQAARGVTSWNVEGGNLFNVNGVEHRLITFVDGSGASKRALVPANVADEILDFGRPKGNSNQLLVVDLAEGYTKKWKAGALSFFGAGAKYQATNLQGDSSMLLSEDPAAAKYLARATSLVKTAAKGQPLNAQQQRILKLAHEGRVIDSGEFGTTKDGVPVTAKVKELAPQRYAFSGIKSWYRTLGTNREAIPRLAKLWADVDRIDKGELPYMGTGNAQEMAAAGMKPEEIATHNARNATLDYGGMGQAQNAASKFLLPFTKFYFGNLGKTSMLIRKTPLRAAAVTLAPMLASYAWNNTGDRKKDEDALPGYIRKTLHIVTGGHTEDGRPIVVRLPWPAVQALETVGINNDTWNRVVQMASGEKGIGQAAKEQGLDTLAGPAQQLYNLLNPLIRTTADVARNTSWTGTPITPNRHQVTIQGLKDKAQYFVDGIIAPVNNFGNVRDRVASTDSLGKKALKLLNVGPGTLGVTTPNPDSEAQSRFFNKLRELQGKRTQATADNEDTGKAIPVGADWQNQLAYLNRVNSQYFAAKNGKNPQPSVWTILRKLRKSDAPEDKAMVKEIQKAVADITRKALKGEVPVRVGRAGGAVRVRLSSPK